MSDINFINDLLKDIECNNFKNINQSLKDQRLNVNIIDFMKKLIYSCHYRFIKIMLKKKFNYFKNDMDLLIEYSIKEGNSDITNLLIAKQKLYNKRFNILKKVAGFFLLIIFLLSFLEIYCRLDNYYTDKRVAEHKVKDMFDAIPAQCCEVKRRVKDELYWFFKIYF